MKKPMKIPISVSKTKGYLIFILWLAHLSVAWADTVDPIRSMPPHPVGHTDKVWSVAYSPDGRYVLSGSSDDTLKLWNVSSGAEIRTFQGHTDSVRSVAFSPDGSYALSGSNDGTLKLWEVSSGDEIRTFQGHTGWVQSVAFSPDGRYALSGSQDKTLKLWKVSSGDEIRTFQGHTGWVESVAFSPDGRYALSGSQDKTLKLWDVSSGAEIRTFQGHTYTVYSVAFSPDGRYALSGSRLFGSNDGTLKLWDVSSGAEIRTFQGHIGSVMSVAFSPDGRYALSGSFDETVKLWEVSSGAEIRTFQGHIGSVYSVAFSPDGRYALSGSFDEIVKLWEVSSGAEIRTLGYSHKIYAIAISPDGRYALSGSRDNTLKLWEVSSGAEIRTFQGHTDDVRSVAFSPDGLYALSGSRDKTLKLWEVSSGTEIRTFQGHTDDVKSVAFSPDGLYALSGSRDKTLKLWEVSSGAEIRTFQGHNTSVNSVAYSTDGRYALSGSVMSLKLWEVSSGAEIRSFRGGHSSEILSVALSPDGRYALSGESEGSSLEGSLGATIKLWEVSSGAEIRTFQGHTFFINSLAFSPDGRYALSGSASVNFNGKDYDKTLQLWKVSSGAEIRTFQGHTLYVNSVAFSPDGRYAFSGSSYDKTLKMWETGIQGKEPVNQPPQAVFTVSPTQGQAPLTVHLDASASSDPDGSIVKYEWALNGEPFDSGNPLSYTFTTAFEYQGSITLTVTDNQGLTASTQQNVSITVAPPPTDSVGQAIIIAGPQASDNLFKYSNDFSQRMYRLLKKRRFSDEDVHYMNVLAPDIEKPLDGRPEPERQDYELFEPEGELEEAFAQAAARLSPGQQFIFYIHAHAREDRVYLQNYELSASKLGDLLATLPAGTQQIIIIDTCYSGSFLDDLAGVENRVVITSTNDKSLTWQIADSSFADKFMRQIEFSSSVLEAFQSGKELVVSEPGLFGEQRPWLDDDGDGQFLNDGKLAANIYIGGQGISQAPAPLITQVHPRRTLAENESSATLWVKTSPSGDNLYKVQAVLVAPNYVLNEYQGESSNFDRIEIELTYNAARDRYEVLYDKFYTAGFWRIFYQVQDTDGVWSEITTGEVQAQESSLLPTVKMEMNQSRYTTNDPLRLDMTVNGQAVVDLYVALIFPEGIFFTLDYPFNFSWPNTAQVYRPKVEIAGQQTYSIMNFPLPADVGLGQYNACGVMVTPDAAPLEQANWIHVDCAEFEVY